MAGLDGIGSGGRLDLTNYLAALGKSTNVEPRPQSAEAAQQSGTNNTTGDVATVDPRVAVQQILAGYDLRQITPRQFSELTQQLHDAGAISDTDRANFTLLRQSLDSEGVSPDEPVDLFAFVQDRLKQLRDQASDVESSGDATASDTRDVAQQTATALSQYDWLVKLDTIRQLGDGATVDQRA